MNENQLIIFEKKRNYVIITLNRPEYAHAFNLDLMNEFYAKLQIAEKSESIKFIVLKSTGDKVFSAGIDIKTTSKDDSKNLAKMREMGRAITECMISMKKPIIVQIQGTAIGFGMELIMASDLRFFADKPKDEMFFRMPEIAIGIYPQTGATILPLYAFGLNYAKNLLLTADKIGLDDLKNLNFPTRIFPPDRLEIETKKFIRTFAKRLDSFMFLIKSSLHIMYNKYIKEWYDLEDSCGEFAYLKKNHQELDEFIEKLKENYP